MAQIVDFVDYWFPIFSRGTEQPNPEEETINMSLPKIRDEEKERVLGYVHAVSGPGMISINYPNSNPKK